MFPNCIFPRHPDYLFNFRAAFLATIHLQQQRLLISKILTVLTCAFTLLFLIYFSATTRKSAIVQLSTNCKLLRSNEYIQYIPSQNTMVPIKKLRHTFEIDTLQ